MPTPPVYRAPLRSRDDAVPAGAAVERALATQQCGLGGRLDATPESVVEAAKAAAAQHDERLARRIERFATAPDGALVWTRDIDDLLWLGRLAGGWRYDDTAEAARVDLVHVRPCRWLPAPIEPADAPAGVLAAFRRGGRNWQRIQDAAVAEESMRLWIRLR